MSRLAGGAYHPLRPLGSGAGRQRYQRRRQPVKATQRRAVTIHRTSWTALSWTLRRWRRNWTSSTRSAIASPPTDTAVHQHQHRHPMLAGLRGQPSNIIGRQIPRDACSTSPEGSFHSARRIGCQPFSFQRVVKNAREHPESRSWHLTSFMAAIRCSTAARSRSAIRADRHTCATWTRHADSSVR